MLSRANRHILNLVEKWNGVTKTFAKLRKVFLKFGCSLRKAERTKYIGTSKSQRR